MIKVGFEPTPFRTSALSWRLRPLGHLTFVTVRGPEYAQMHPVFLTLRLPYQYLVGMTKA